MKISAVLRWVFALSLLALSVMVADAYDFEKDGLYYARISENQVTVVRGNDDSATDYLNGLTEIVIPETVEHDGVTYTVSEIAQEAFKGCSINTVSVPSTVVTIREYAFSESTIQHISLAEGVEYIMKGAFYECAQLEEFIAPVSLTHTGWKILKFCTNLKHAYFGPNFQAFEHATFQACRAMETLTIEAVTPPVSENSDVGVLYGPTEPDEPYPDCSMCLPMSLETCVLYVPAASLDLYRNSDTWSYIQHIEAIPESGVPVVVSDDAGWTVTAIGGTLIISAAEGSSVSVVSADGMTLCRRLATGGSPITMSARPGVYVVTVDGRSRKISL